MAFFITALFALCILTIAILIAILLYEKDGAQQENIPPPPDPDISRPNILTRLADLESHRDSLDRRLLVLWNAYRTGEVEPNMRPRLPKKSRPEGK